MINPEAVKLVRELANREMKRGPDQQLTDDAVAHILEHRKYPIRGGAEHFRRFAREATKTVLEIAGRIEPPPVVWDKDPS